VREDERDGGRGSAEKRFHLDIVRLSDVGVVLVRAGSCDCSLPRDVARESRPEGEFEREGWLSEPSERVLACRRCPECPDGTCMCMGGDIVSLRCRSWMDGMGGMGGTWPESLDAREEDCERREGDICRSEVERVGNDVVVEGAEFGIGRSFESGDAGVGGSTSTVCAVSRPGASWTSRERLRSKRVSRAGAVASATVDATKPPSASCDDTFETALAASRMCEGRPLRSAALLVLQEMSM
jgi:hypothetical protein